MDLSSLDPDLLPALEQMQQALGATSLDLADIGAARAMHEAISQQAIAAAPEYPHVQNERKTIHDEAFGIDVELETYVAKNRVKQGPAILFIHGGGYVTGAAHQASPQLSRWAHLFGAYIISVEYRLAPEHPFPAALHDCFAALKWLSEYAENLAIDPARIILMGESAGGGLAAGLALYTRDNSDIQLAYQMLVYPMIDHKNVAPADQTRADTLLWSRANNKMGWDSYLGEGGVSGDMLHYAAPGTAENLRGLPPAFIPVGDQDLFIQESQAYAERLHAAGVEADLKIYSGAFHGFDAIAPDAPVSVQFKQDIEAALRLVCQSDSLN